MADFDLIDVTHGAAKMTVMSAVILIVDAFVIDHALARWRYYATAQRERRSNQQNDESTSLQHDVFPLIARCRQRACAALVRSFRHDT